MMTNTTPPARCLDLSRLMSRVGRGLWTGVDRVEAAYLDRLLSEPTPLFGFVRSGLGYVLLDKDGMYQIAQRLHGKQPWGRPDLLSRLFLKNAPARRAAESDLRRVCLARASRAGLGRMLRRHLPANTTYLNVGHANLRPHLFEALKQVEGLRSAVLIHDMIPLDLPEMQRDGTVDSFAARMRAVSRYGDLVIYNSRQSQQDGARHFANMGRVPDSIVAHLGQTALATDGALPPDLDTQRPYFVTIGTVEPRKNHALLLNVWERLSQTLPQADMPQLYITGARGWKNEEVFARLDANPPFVREVTGLSDAQMGALLHGARALLFPSLAEGFGLPPLEAAALGVPVIVNDLPVYREFLGNYPIYANADDLYLWEHRITELAKHTETQTRTGIKSLPSWDEHFQLVFSQT